MKTQPKRFALLTVLLGALLAVVEGFDKLGCASRANVLITVAGSFGAGASLIALLRERRAP